jgi:hypothetical protein
MIVAPRFQPFGLPAGAVKPCVVLATWLVYNSHGSIVAHGTTRTQNQPMRLGILLVRRLDV